MHLVIRSLQLLIPYGKHLKLKLARDEFGLIIYLGVYADKYRLTHPICNGWRSWSKVAIHRPTNKQIKLKFYKKCKN